LDRKEAERRREEEVLRRRQEEQRRHRYEEDFYDNRSVDDLSEYGSDRYKAELERVVQERFQHPSTNIIKMTPKSRTGTFLLIL
jgi:hypothetical protein